MLRRFTASACLAAAIAAALPSASHAAPSIQGLGDLPGGATNSSALGVSNDGQTAVGQSGTVNGTTNVTEAFRWQNGTMTRLGDLQFGTYDSRALGVSGNGLVVVGRSNSGANSLDNRIEAFRWTEAGGIVGLGDLAGGSFQSYAQGASFDGTVIAGYSNGTNGFEAVRWQNGDISALGDLSGGTFDSRAFGINGDGSVIVGRGNSGNGFEAFRWQNGAMTGLGDLEGGNFGSLAQGVSFDGSTVVGYGTSATGLQAFRYQNGSMNALPFLPGGGTQSEALSVSNDGSFVVGYAVSANNPSAFEAVRWNAAGEVETLWDLLTGLGVNPAASGWTQLNRATGITPDGTAIVGFGTRNLDGTAVTEAFLVTIPEPASMALLLPAGLTLLRRRRRA